MTTHPKNKKRKVLRYNEYYNTQELFDRLYDKSSKGYNFTNLVDLIRSPQNIMLAYRKIKRNKGSKTAGVDNLTIGDVAQKDTDTVVKYFQGRLDKYKPDKIRRVEIPKPNGKVRLLGIPTIEDRIIQQCIKQVLEPIVEAKFHPQSYGFRPNRSTHYAMGRVHHLINNRQLHFVVDIDIKGFFDNVNHAKLIKQMWTMGIRDKNLFCILKKMLRAEVDGVGIPQIGTPQGGILSPLLSNIVLNELDWWIGDQWESFETRHKYKDTFQSSKYHALRKSSSLKEMCIVRYADDFKIFCRDYKSAKKVFEAVKMWLMERLKLEISEEKSTITNLRKHYTEFLGVKFKARPKKKKFVIKSHITDKAKKEIANKIRKAIERIKKNPSTDTANKYNALILGLHNYYKIATMVSADFHKIAFLVKKNLYNSLRTGIKEQGRTTEAFREHYGQYNYKIYYICDTALFPINGIKSKAAYQFKQQICNYTHSGRMLVHDNLQRVSIRILQYLMSNPVKGQSVEYNDNRISLYVGQGGKCRITKVPLRVGNMEVHHIVPKAQGGIDDYKNLVFIDANAHKLIHAKDKEVIVKYIKQLNPNITMINEINKFRVKVGNCIIEK